MSTPHDASTPRYATFSLAIFFLSGIAGLGYQIVWARMFAIGLGHELPSVFAVIAAFFGGLALGGLALDRRVSVSSRPGRWYAGLELLIGSWALLTVVLIPQLNLLVHGLTGVAPSPLRHWLVAFGLPFLGLLPATVAMGATLPAMDRFVSALRSEGRPIGSLYAANTLGAAAGVLLSAFVLVPEFGFRMTVVIFAAVNFLCALSILVWPGGREAGREAVVDPVADNVSPARLKVTLALTGLLGIGYEVLSVRVMAQVLESTVYSYASALTVYLLFTSLGAAIYYRWARRSAFRPALIHLLIGLATTCLLGVLVLGRAGELYEAIAVGTQPSLARGVTAESVLAALVFAGPTLFMGATFSHLAQAARHARGGIGRALGINTIGGTVAPILFGVILLPHFGAKIVLTLTALGYLLLIPTWRDMRAAAAVVPLGLVWALPPNLVLVTPPQGGRILAYREGVMAAVSVVDDAEGHRYLKVNNRFHMGGTVGHFSQRRLGHVPLLLHPGPERALFLGVGTGISAGAATIYPGLHIDAVELVPEIVELIPHFDDLNGRLLEHPNVEVYVADARRFVRASREQYDVVVADLFHPARDGSGALYTREHFQAIRDRLAPGGLFCQWLPLYQLDHEMLRLILRTFLDVYPHAQAFMSHYNVETPALALIGSTEPLDFPTDWFERRTAGTPIVDGLFRHQQGLSDGFALFGLYVADRDGLARFAGEGPLNTDDRPLVVFRAPRFIYVQHRYPYERLMALLEMARPDLSALFAAPDPDAGFIADLQALLRARDRFLAGEVAYFNGQIGDALVAWVESARISPNFDVGYLYAIQYARDVAGPAPDLTRGLLRKLRGENPNRPEAGRLLSELFGER